DFISFARAIELSGSQHLGGSPDAAALAKSIQANPEAARKDNRPAWFACALYQRVREKLQREPVEDFRIDFEDGFGNRPDEEEDATAVKAAEELAIGMQNKTVSPFIGIRIKPFTEDLKYRGVRTLDLFLTALLQKTNGK